MTTTELRRYRVTFHGALSSGASDALVAAGLADALMSTGGAYGRKSEPSDHVVGVYAASESDAILRVRDAVDAHGTDVGFEAYVNV